MRLVYPSSLAKTLDAVNQVFFTGQKLTKADRLEVARFIASRHGLKGSYANMFAPTEKDRERGIQLFTGEKMTSVGGSAHILGEEACRALHLLKVPDKKVQRALEEATAGMQERLDLYAYKEGIYCCGKCSAALWRHTVVGDFRNPEKLLAAGMKALKGRRDGKGRWGSFPFYYTLLALSEIDMPAAVKEIKYAAGSIERVLRRKPTRDKFDKRRRMLAERVLAKC